MSSSREKRRTTAFNSSCCSIVAALLVLPDMLASAPGLLIVRGGGVTGMGSRIRLRGVQSLVADRAPIVFVDGMRVDLGEDAFQPVAPFGANFVELPRLPGPLRLDDLNPNDVESIEVITGPASAALYGAAANAGVILGYSKLRASEGR